MADTFPPGFIPVGDAFAKALSSIKECNSVLSRELADQGDINKFFDDYDALARDVERLMRDAIADGRLRPFCRTQSGQMEQLVDRESFRPAAFGVPHIQNVPDPFTNPGPDTEGAPTFLKTSEFEDWLKTNRIKKNKRVGSPMKFDWPDAEAFAAGIFRQQGEFREWDSEWKSQADLERKVLTYMERTTGPDRGPAESTVRAYVAKWLTKWREGQ